MQSATALDVRQFIDERPVGRYQLLASGLGLVAVTVLAPGGVTGWRRR